MFHLHLDAAHLPAPLLDRMLHEGGFHLDDFPHELKLGESHVWARHLTKFLYAPISSPAVKTECLRLKSWAEEFGFKGLIQCEYVMEETEWRTEQASLAPLLSPFKILTRPLSRNRGDQFKKHEVHLELNKVESSEYVIEALRGCGLQVLENETTVTFTTAGHSKEMLALRDELKKFLALHEREFTGKLTYEATAFWSLHGIDSASLPQIVHKILPLKDLPTL